MSTGLNNRQERVAKLYELRRKITAEIAALENEVAEEIRAMQRAKELARTHDINARFRRRRVAVCGTDGGYTRHVRTLKEPACEACKLAHRVYEAERVARKVRESQQGNASTGERMETSRNSALTLPGSDRPTQASEQRG